jgi:hypothetical protein
MCSKLETTTIRELIARAQLPAGGDKVLQLEAGWSVADALDALAKKRVRSAPVVEDGKVLGFFDVRDLVSREFRPVRFAFSRLFQCWRAAASHHSDGCAGGGDAGSLHAGQEAGGDCVERV